LLGNLLTLFDNFCISLIRLIAPKACAVCGAALGAGENVICSVCNAHLPRTSYWQQPYDNTMARMLWGRMAVERAAALFYFEPQSEVSHIIYSFKYRKHPENAEHMGRLAAKELSLSGFFKDIDAIVPVPLARSRQRSRGYNQSYEIAKGIRGITGIPIINGAVIRRTFTESQTHKSRWERIENVENVFELKKPGLLHGKHVLVVDDVVTTGSTIAACSREIVKSGDVKVSVFALGFTFY